MQNVSGFYGGIVRNFALDWSREPNARMNLVSRSSTLLMALYHGALSRPHCHPFLAGLAFAFLPRKFCWISGLCNADYQADPALPLRILFSGPMVVLSLVSCSILFIALSHGAFSPALTDLLYCSILLYSFPFRLL